MDEAVFATRAAVPALSSTLARALADDPGWIYLFPDPATRVRDMSAMLGLMVGKAYVDLDATWMLGDQRAVAAAAVWMPPGRRHVPWSTQLGAAPGLAWLLKRRTLRGLKLLRAMDQAAPREPHYYLTLLGVAPQEQGRGLGQRVLTPVLEVCDATRTLAWLETSNPANHGFYRRLGFVDAAQTSWPGGPTLTFMARTPR